MNFTVPFVWARVNELIRNRTPPIRIRVESQEIDEENSEFLLNFVLVSAFSFAPSMGTKQRISTTNNTEEGV